MLSLPDMRGLRKLSCGCWTTQCEYLHQHTIKTFLLISIHSSILDPINANISWLIMLGAQYSETDCRYAFVLEIYQPFHRQN
jgi:hypothetical protein